jgi:hypothetical protein
MSEEVGAGIRIGYLFHEDKKKTKKKKVVEMCILENVITKLHKYFYLIFFLRVWVIIFVCCQKLLCYQH